MASVRIALISDLHGSEQCSIATRKGEFAEVLLLRTVHRLNRFIKPDLVLVLGDLLDDGHLRADNYGRYRTMREHLDLLECRYAVIPGNHDAQAEVFYDYFPRQEQFVDVEGYRLMMFADDPEEPICNARRDEGNLAVMRQARDGFTGPIISVQHVPLLPREGHGCPYHYSNAEAIGEVMEECGIFLSISGHYHTGIEPFAKGQQQYVVTPAICEAPFPFWLLDIEGEKVTVEKHQLRIPERFQLIDRHIHTEFAYCGENVTMASTEGLAELFGLADFGYAEHSDQLYCSRESWGRNDYVTAGLACVNENDNRMPRYFELSKSLGVERRRLGLEAEVNTQGELMVFPYDREKLGFLVGAVHYLNEAKKEPRDMQQINAEFIWQTKRLLEHGVDVLAHPFRVFNRAKLGDPSELYEPVVNLLRKHKAAVEVNFHTNTPPLPFIQQCLDAKIKIAFGSDSHNRYEIGEFYPHLKLMEAAGYTGDLSDVLVEP